ncbi:MAG: hypothetical protein WAX77_11495 [Methylococcaceae bacterium]
MTDRKDSKYLTNVSIVIIDKKQNCAFAVSIFLEKRSPFLKNKPILLALFTILGSASKE